MFDFTIRPDGADPYEVQAGSRDVVVWEKTGRKTFAGLMENLAMTDLYQLAHIASKRLGLYDGTLAEFEQTCEIDFTETHEPDPTNEGPSTGPSSPSPSQPASPRRSGRSKTTEPS